ncbi:MAG: hypothetical protein R3C44_11750 [Chloroflexota bacterium]
MWKKNPVEPVPIIGVFLAAIPGILMTVSRYPGEGWQPILSAAGMIYLVILVLGIAVSYYRDRQFPVWALLPAGAAAWLATYMLGNGLSSVADPFSPLGASWLAILLVDMLAASIIFAVALRSFGSRTAVWPYLGLLLVVALLALFIAFPDSVRSGSGSVTRFLGWLMIPVEALLFVAVGALAARQHGVLALLVVIGGYAYMLSDSDYLSGFLMQDWSWLHTYIAAMTTLFLIVVPVAFMRARTQVGRAVALFGPATVFLIARLAVPALVLGGTSSLMAGGRISVAGDSAESGARLVVIQPYGWTPAVEPVNGMDIVLS